jgi:putative membrane protein
MTRTKIFQATTLSLGLVLAACGPKATTTNTVDTTASTTNDTMMTNDTAMTTAPSPTSAQGFANAAAASDAFEIESSKLAATKASSAKVKAFAAQMIAAHTKSTAKLKATAATLSPAITPDPTLAPDQQAMLDSLKAVEGTAFDTTYATNQAAAHQSTLDKLKAYAANGEEPKFKEIATGLIPTVTAHLNMAKGLK